MNKEEQIKELRKFLKGQTKNTLINLLIKASIYNKYLENKLKPEEAKPTSEEAIKEQI